MDAPTTKALQRESVRSKKRRGRRHEPFGRAPGEDATDAQVVNHTDNDDNDMAVGTMVCACLMAASTTVLFFCRNNTHG